MAEEVTAHMLKYTDSFDGIEDYLDLEETEEAPPFDLTVIDDKEDVEYAEFLKGLCNILIRGHNEALDNYWVTGEAIHQFAKRQQDGGKRNVAKLLREISEDLSAVTSNKIKYSESTLRKMLRFREMISKDQLARIKKLGLPVSQANSMCVKDLEDEDRDVIIENLESGAEKAPNVKELIEEMKGKAEAPPKEPKRLGPMDALKKLNKLLENTADLIEGDFTLGAALVLSPESEDQEAREKFIDGFHIAKNRVTTLNRMFDTSYGAYGLDEVAPYP